MLWSLHSDLSKYISLLKLRVPFIVMKTHGPHLVTSGSHSILAHPASEAMSKTCFVLLPTDDSQSLLMKTSVNSCPALICPSVYIPTTVLFTEGQTLHMVLDFMQPQRSKWPEAAPGTCRKVFDPQKLSLTLRPL